MSNARTLIVPIGALVFTAIAVVAGPASAQVTRQELAGLRRCQSVVNTASQAFFKTQVNNLMACLATLTNRDLLGTPALVALANKRCHTLQKVTTSGSAKFIDRVVEACHPDFVFIDEDPLQLAALLYDELGFGPAPGLASSGNWTTVLAGIICLRLEDAAEAAVGSTLPAGFGDLATEFEWPQLDPRCLNRDPFPF